MVTVHRVLVADDEKVIADSLVRILALSNYEASAVYSGEEAVEAAMRLKPDVVLTDVVMGLMSGIVAGMIIRRSLPDCRVILFSGHAQNSPMLDDAASKGHHFEILAKPIEPDVLLEYLSGGKPIA
jgi:DNA-binding NtrC family response regulator